jgi:hypothetical protein
VWGGRLVRILAPRGVARQRSGKRKGGKKNGCPTLVALLATGWEEWPEFTNATENAVEDQL